MELYEKPKSAAMDADGSSAACVRDDRYFKVARVADLAPRTPVFRFYGLEARRIYNNHGETSDRFLRVETSIRMEKVGVCLGSINL